jgi:hypothetical protein
LPWLALLIAASCSRSGQPQTAPPTISAAPASASPALAAAAPSGPARIATVDTNPRFVNVAPEGGITTVLFGGGAYKDHLLESVGTGAAFIDYDEDGRLDIYLVNAWALEEEPSRIGKKGQNVLYRNRGDGTFEDVTQKVRVADDSWGCGVCAGDFDNDGHVDLYVTNFGPNRLYRNRGDGTFEQVAERAGVADPGWSAGASFFDADGDGDLDLYVSNYVQATFEEVLQARRTNLWREKTKVMVGPFGLRGGRDHFYRNEGNGTFKDATDRVGMTDTAESYGLGVLTSDLDSDGDVDVFVANDSNPNFVYRNDGKGIFTEIGSFSGAGLNHEGLAQAGMGVDAADFDGDGLQDIGLSTFIHDSFTLYRNLGGLQFEDVSIRLGLRKMTYDVLKWGCGFFDFDLDGDVDLMIVNGHIYPQVDQTPELGETYRQLPILLRNDGGKLTDVSRLAGPGFQTAVSGRGLAVGDYDDDGDLDLLITVMDGPPLLLRNDTPRRGHWLKVRLLNQHGSPAINARAVLAAGGRTQIRELRSGSTYQSQSALELHFGLGTSTAVDSLELVWPGGQKTRMTSVSADQTITLREPKRPSTTLR